LNCWAAVFNRAEDRGGLLDCEFWCEVVLGVFKVHEVDRLPILKKVPSRALVVLDGTIAAGSKIMALIAVEFVSSRRVSILWCWGLLLLCHDLSD